MSESSTSGDIAILFSAASTFLTNENINNDTVSCGSETVMLNLQSYTYGSRQFHLQHSFLMVSQHSKFLGLCM